MGITIRDIAKATGYGYGTVARALSGEPCSIKEETKNIILEVAEKHGYIKDMTAQALGKGKTTDIGLIIPAVFGSTFYNDYYIKLISGVMEEVKKSGYKLRVFLLEKEEDLSEIIAEIRSLKIAGIIYSSIFYVGFNVAKKNLQEIDVTTVVLNEQMKGSNIWSVVLDDFRGGYDGTKYLLDLGHKDIATIRGRWKDIEKRFEGYKKAMLDYGVPTKDEFVQKGDSTEKAGYEGMKKILAEQKRPTAVFALDDEMAIGAIRAINEKGLKCPDDISVLGFDGMDIGLFAIPRLTTVVRPVGIMAKMAVDILMGTNAGIKKCEKIKSGIIERESCRSF